MSYLNLPSLFLDDTSKGTISLWFRFSQDSVDAARRYGESYQTPDMGDFALGPDIFRSTIPLVTFGRKVMAHTYGTEGHIWTQAAGGAVMQAVTFDVVTKNDSPCEPSHLGLEVRNEADGIGGVTLKMAFQTETRAQVQGMAFEVTDVHWAQPSPGAPFQQYQTVQDVSFIRTGEPEVFLIRPKFQVKPDEWHHLLVSFDFTTSVDVVALEVEDGGPDTEEGVRNATIKSYCKFWYAFDDKNKKGKDNIGNSIGFEQPPSGWVPQDQNGIIPQTAERAVLAYSPATPDPSVTGGDVNPEYHWTSSKIPIKQGPVGLPASTEYVNTIYHCEMAEFQMWAGLALDAGNEANRRAFIDCERDEDGNAIGPLKPVNPEKAEELMGRRPDILLHGSSKWKKGYNTGLTGLEESSTGEPEKISSGQFTPVGGIKKYKPDPSLGEEATA